MSLRLGLAISPRSVHALPLQPVTEILPQLIADVSVIPATKTTDGLTVSSGPYAGNYKITRADLVKRPLCLLPATLGAAEAGQPLMAVPGLWAYDPDLGEIAISRSWMAADAGLPGASGLQLSYADELTDQAIVHVETACQGDLEAVQQSQAAIWPALQVPPDGDGVTPSPETPDVFEPEWLVLSDQRIALAKLTPDLGNVSFSLEAPSLYQGSYTIDWASLSQGPVCLVSPTITGEATDGTTLTAAPGLWVSFSEQLTITGQWLRDGQPDGPTGPLRVIRSPEDSGARLAYRETAEDGAGTRQATSPAANVQSIPVITPPPSSPIDEGIALEWLGATGGYSGTPTVNADGSVTVTSDRSNKSGNPRVYFEVTPGTTYHLETAVEYGDASRIIGRLSDASGNTSSLNVTVFDISRPVGQTQLLRSDTFTPTTGRNAMHYVFVMGATGQARILPATRVKEVS